MSITDHDQLYLLVVFSAAALFRSLIRTHVFEEEVTWGAARFGDPSVVGELLVRGGTAFVTIAVVGSLLLTFTATSAPLQGLWSDLPRQFQDLARLIQQLAPTGGESKGTGIVGFPPDATTAGRWDPSAATAFRAEFNPAEEDLFKWRAGTYAVYPDSLDGWTWDKPDVVPIRRVTVVANDPYQTTTFFDAPTPVGRREVRFTVMTDRFVDPTIIGPNSIRTVDQSTQAIAVGVDGWFIFHRDARGHGLVHGDGARAAVRHRPERDQ